ncbi:MAG: hypothetical protein J5861_06625 [Desulfovibrio sp.]|nr:hypothetical protein [Desulfovibrio sp.]
MSRKLVILVFFTVTVALTACSEINMRNPFTSDPLTGGVNTGTSRLLDLSIPPGMQMYPTHGSSGTDGGMEIFRGRVDMATVAQYMHLGLQGQGWNLRLARRKDSRAVYVYERATSLATLTVERTALGTLLCIWTGERLPDGSALPQDLPSQPDASPSVDEAWGGAAPPSPAGSVETWGDGGSVQERTL